MTRIVDLLDDSATGGADNSWIRGEDVEMVLTVTDDTGALEDLTTAIDIELRVKDSPDDADPPLLALSLGSGITVRSPQTGSNLGLADVVATAAQTFALVAGLKHYDVFVVRASGKRKCAISPQSRLQIGAVVNFPP